MLRIFLSNDSKSQYKFYIEYQNWDSVSEHLILNNKWRTLRIHFYIVWQLTKQIKSDFNFIVCQ